nr:Tn3 family transposase [Streptomyces sp. Tu 3180]
MEGLLVSLVALLVSQSCNIGLTPVIDTENKALTRSRLSHVDQNYVRVDTIAAANAALITAQSRIELAQMWGGGLLASVDGLRFVVPVKTINTGPSPRYYGYKRGVTWLNAVNDQVAGIGAMVVRGTPRDCLYTLDTLLNLDGGVKPEMVATDNASYSDMAFGLYKMLGFRFAPRFRDLDDQRFWRADLPDDGETSAAGYGPLEAVDCNKVNLKRIVTHWPDMLRVAVYMTLAGLRLGQSIAVVVQHVQRDNAAGPTWRLPAKNNSSSAVTRLQPVPRPVVWALDEYLPVRTHKAPHSTETTGLLLLSRTGHGLDRVTFPRLLRTVAATHPDLKDIAPFLLPDVVARSPSPFAEETDADGDGQRPGI